MIAIIENKSSRPMVPGRKHSVPPVYVIETLSRLARSMHADSSCQSCIKLGWREGKRDSAYVLEEATASKVTVARIVQDLPHIRRAYSVLRMYIKHAIAVTAVTLTPTDAQADHTSTNSPSTRKKEGGNLHTTAKLVTRSIL